MKNLKTLSIMSDGAKKRIAITFDVLDEDGKVIKSNQKVNRIVTDEKVLASIEELELYANVIIDAE